MIPFCKRPRRNILKVVILAGGLGTRISEETSFKPKPMVEIGGIPILHHILNIYSKFGYNDFIVCCGYKGEVIKEYFRNLKLLNSDFEIQLDTGEIRVLGSNTPPWNVKLIDTGPRSMTGGRLKRIAQYLDDSEPFFMTYGDGLSDINISELLKFHRTQKTLATLTTVNASGRFGALQLDGDKVSQFREKYVNTSNYISGGFFVLEKQVLDLIDGDQCVWEDKPLMSLARDQQLSAFRHTGFWHPMDSLKDRNHLQEIWDTGDAPWM